MRTKPIRRKHHAARRRGNRRRIAARTPRRLTQRELKRLRVAVGRPPRESRIRGDRWTAERIARLVRVRFRLRWSPRYAVRALRARGVRFRLTRAREPKLSAARVRTLRALLRRTPAQVGLVGDHWSRARVAHLINLRFGVAYTTQHVGRLLRTLGIVVPLSRSPRRLTADQANTLRTLLAQSPLTAGLTRRSWTRPLIVTLIAERFGVHYHPQSIPAMLARWQIVLIRAPGGRARALSAEQATQLAQTLAHSPHDAGLAGNVWTARSVAQIIEQRFSLRYSVLSVRRALARWGLRPLHTARRGGLTHVNADQIAKIATALMRPPTESGYECRTWSRELLARLIHEQFNADYSVDSITRLLRRHGLRLRAPATALAEGQPSSPEAIATSAPASSAPSVTPSLAVARSGIATIRAPGPRTQTLECLSTPPTLDGTRGRPPSSQ